MADLDSIERGVSPLTGQMSSGPEKSVMLWDPSRLRGLLVRQLIRELGGTTQLLEGGHLDEALVSRDKGGITLIALEDRSQPDDLAGERIAQHKNAHRLVVAYADHANRWPVRSKCQPLLSGAARLLDSASGDFPVELRQVLEQAFATQARLWREHEETACLMSEHGIVGQSPGILSAFRLARRFSQLSDLPVLLTGESGTGKELLARAIARLDPKRHRGPFLAVNCAAVQPNLLESEFFGHRRGAFTGADRHRKGWIRAAEGGVLFLDEIGELNPGLQAKLLRVIQENRVLGVGEEQDVPVNIRFIAATNQNLEQRVAEERFRADLYHRLRVLHVHLPPLRDRALDLSQLLEHFAEKHRTIQTAPVAGFTRDYVEALEQLELPGNVRQLENLVRQSFINHANPGELDLADLPQDILRKLSASTQGEGDRMDAVEIPPAREVPRATVSPSPMDDWVRQLLVEKKWDLTHTLRACERVVYEAALAHTQGNQAQAARLLGVTSRCVYNKVRKHHLSL